MKIIKVDFVAQVHAIKFLLDFFIPYMYRGILHAAITLLLLSSEAVAPPQVSVKRLYHTK